MPCGDSLEISLSLRGCKAQREMSPPFPVATNHDEVEKAPCFLKAIVQSCWGSDDAGALHAPAKVGSSGVLLRHNDERACLSKACHALSLSPLLRLLPQGLLPVLSMIAGAATLRLLLL